VSERGDHKRGVKDRVVTAPSYEQLAALVAAQERTIARLQARIAEQDAEIAELERQLAASSRNSFQLARDNGVGRSTAYRYLHEGIDVLAAAAPGLRGRCWLPALPAIRM
jgi:DNA-binding phage protein